MVLRMQRENRVVPSRPVEPQLGIEVARERRAPRISVLKRRRLSRGQRAIILPARCEVSVQHLHHVRVEYAACRCPHATEMGGLVMFERHIPLGMQVTGSKGDGGFGGTTGDVLVGYLSVVWVVWLLLSPARSQSSLARWTSQLRFLLRQPSFFLGRGG